MCASSVLFRFLMDGRRVEWTLEIVLPCPRRCCCCCCWISRSRTSGELLNQLEASRLPFSLHPLSSYCVDQNWAKIRPNHTVTLDQKPVRPRCRATQSRRSHSIPISISCSYSSVVVPQTCFLLFFSNENKNRKENPRMDEPTLPFHSLFSFFFPFAKGFQTVV